MDCNQTDIEYLSEEMYQIYHRYMNVNFFIGGILLISNFGLMIQNSNIMTKLKEIKNNMNPPIYKSSV